MTRFPSLRFFILFAILCASCAPLTPTAPNTLPAADENMQEAVADVFAVNRLLGRGVNFGNALEAPNYEGEWGMRIEAEFFTLLAEAGFNSVRIPIRWSAYAAVQPPYTIEPEIFERVDWAIEQAHNNGLAVVINMHHYEEMISDPDGHTERWLALWAQIAEHYQDQPPSLVFELLNEPNGRLTATKWNQIFPQALAVVRQSNPTRAVIIGPSQWNNIGYVSTLVLPNDPNLIVTFHYYDPFPFTHQGAEWVDGSTAWMGATWDGNQFEQQAVSNAFDAVTKWAKQQNRPLFMGEFGSYSKADLASRERWTAFIAQTAVERDISFAYWEFGAGFGVYDRSARQWNDGLRDGLLGSNQP